MVIKTALQCMKNTTRPINIETDADGRNLSAPVKLSFSEPLPQTQFLFGESLLTNASTREPAKDSKASTVPCSETRVDTYQASLSDRLTPLLISRGLVKGIIPTSMRKQSRQGILGIAFFVPDGHDAE